MKLNTKHARSDAAIPRQPTGSTSDSRPGFTLDFVYNIVFKIDGRSTRFFGRLMLFQNEVSRCRI